MCTAVRTYRRHSPLTPDTIFSAPVTRVQRTAGFFFRPKKQTQLQDALLLRAGRPGAKRTTAAVFDPPPPPSEVNRRDIHRSRRRAREVRDEYNALHAHVRCVQYCNNLFVSLGFFVPVTADMKCVTTVGPADVRFIGFVVLQKRRVILVANSSEKLICA